MFASCGLASRTWSTAAASASAAASAPQAARQNHQAPVPRTVQASTQPFPARRWPGLRLRPRVGHCHRHQRSRRRCCCHRRRRGHRASACWAVLSPRRRGWTRVASTWARTRWAPTPPALWQRTWHAGRLWSTLGGRGTGRQSQAAPRPARTGGCKACRGWHQRGMYTHPATPATPGSLGRHARRLFRRRGWPPPRQCGRSRCGGRLGETQRLRARRGVPLQCGEGMGTQAVQAPPCVP